MSVLLSNNIYQRLLYGLLLVYGFRDSTDEEQTIFEKLPERKRKLSESKTWFKNKSSSGYSRIDAGEDADDEDSQYSFVHFHLRTRKFE